jgi:hypothetical protein
MDDLWPDNLQVVNFKAPVAILREQAEFLGRKTQNIVEGRVQDISSSPGRLILGATIQDFYYGFELVAPALGSYSFRLLSIQHGLAVYPLYLGS